MEIDITHMIQELELMHTLSASQLELGSFAAKITWRNSQDYAQSKPLIKESDRLYVCRYFKSLGFSESDEMEFWPLDDINALVVQLIAGDIRDIEAYDSIDAYLKDENTSGHIFKGSDNKFYYYLGE